MQQPPQANCRRNDQQSEHLVAPEHTRLLIARGLLGLLLVVRLDACLDHSGSRNRLARRTVGAYRISIGECKLNKFCDTLFDFPRPRCR